MIANCLYGKSFWNSGQHVDPAHCDATSRRSLCCKSKRKTRILYKESPLGTSRRTGTLKFPRQLHSSAAPIDSSLPLAGRRTKFARSRRTKRRWSNWHIFDAPLFQDIWISHTWPWRCFAMRCVTMIPSLTGIFDSVTAQVNPIPTSTQISYDLTCARCLYNTGLDVMLSATATDSNIIVKPVSEKKFLCSEQNPAHRARHHALLLPWWRHNQGWQ